MSLLLPLAAAMVFACERPTHHDGDAIRCAGMEQSMRMYGIDAPEMPGACRPGRRCTPGDPYAARDTLRALTRGRAVKCREMDIDSYGRPVVRCTADSIDLGCAMIEAGAAVPRYGRLDCGDIPAPLLDAAGAAPIEVEPPAGYRPQAAPVILPPPRAKAANRLPETSPPPKRYFAPEQPPPGFPRWAWALLAWLPVASLAGAWLMLAERGGTAVRNPLVTAGVLLLAITGGGAGPLGVQVMTGHRAREPLFAPALLPASGLGLGLVFGLLLLALF